MPALADLQGSVRRAVVQGDAPELAPLLVGGRDARKRLAIHHRHYETSLVTTLLDRFPATVWLLGSMFVIEAARQHVRDRPPSKPCLAEYGDDFPAFLSARPGAADFPYLRAFADLEWHLGRLSLAVTRPALTPADLSALPPEALIDLRLTLQADVHYLHAGWAVDALMRLYLTDSAPDRFSLDAGDVWLELRGARGQLRMNRLDRASFAFRTALAAGGSLGDAAMSALDVDASFDPGRTLAGLVTDGLITAIDRRDPKGTT